MEETTLTQVSHQSYGRRMRESCRGLVLGPVLIAAAIALLVWNEGKTVTSHRSLQEALEATHNLPSPDQVDPKFEGSLVHAVGLAQTETPLQDAVFGVQSDTKFLKLKRQVEMFQWVESHHSKTETNSGGGSTTHKVYTYGKDWSNRPIDSSQFQKTQGHENPQDLPFPNQLLAADPILFGGFTLNDEILKLFQWWVDFPEKLSVENIPNETLRKDTQPLPNNRGFYLGTDPANPDVGDTRVTFAVVQPQTVSILAQQMKDTFCRYQTRSGDAILLVESGTHSAAEMYAHAHSQVTFFAWMGRLGGLVLFYCGLLVLVQPLVTVVDVVPWVGPALGNALEGITSCLLFPIALLLSLVVIALAWISYRPVVAGGFLLALAGGDGDHQAHLGPMVHAYAVLEDQEEEDMAVSPHPPPTAPEADLELQATAVPSTTGQVQPLEPPKE